MGKQAVPHCLRQTLRPFGIKKYKKIAESDREQRQKNEQSPDQPKTLPQITHAADPFHQIHQKSRQLQCVLAQNTVHGGPDQLRRQHVHPRYTQRGSYTDQKIPLAPVQKLKYQRDLCIGLLPRLIMIHIKIPSSY